MRKVDWGIGDVGTEDANDGGSGGESDSDFGRKVSAIDPVVGVVGAPEVRCCCCWTWTFLLITGRASNDGAINPPIGIP